MRKRIKTFLLTLCLAAGASPPPAAWGQNYPLLEEINRQTQSLYRDVQAGIVRVQLPVPRWVQEAAANDDPLKRWEKVMDPAVRQKLELQRIQGNQGVPVRITPIVLPPTTRPASRPVGANGNGSGAAKHEPAATAVGDIKENLPGMTVAAPKAMASSSGGGLQGYFSEKPLATPATRRLAREMNVDLRSVPPTGC